MWVLGIKLISPGLARPLIHCLPEIVWKESTEATSVASNLSAEDALPWLASPFLSHSTYQMELTENLYLEFCKVINYVCPDFHQNLI